MWIKTWHWNLNINLIHKYAGRVAKGSVGRKIWWVASKEREREWERQREKNCGTTAGDGEGGDGGQRLQLCLALFDYPSRHLIPLPSIALFRTLCPRQLHADSNNNKNNNSFVCRSCPAACSACCSPRLSPHFSPLRRTSPRLLSSSSSTIFNVVCGEFSVFSFQFILNSRCERIEPHATTR